MSFTQITITGTFTRPDGHPANGTFTATPAQTLQNDGVVLDRTAIVGTVTNGVLKAPDGSPYVLLATDDTDTLPTLGYYVFVAVLDQAPWNIFNAAVPHASGTIDVSALIPIVTPPNPGTQMGGVLSGTFPNPGFASGALANLAVFRAIQATAPATAAFNVNDFWYDTSTES